MLPSRDISRLIEIMAALRTPGTGCPWDLEQDFHTIAPYTIEEAYEVADAIERGDMADLKLELGDLLLQSVYHARMAEEAGQFDFGDVVEAVTRKMIRRHPHVFGNETARSAGMAKGAWERIKAEEKAERIAGRSSMAGAGAEGAGVLDGVPAALPGLVAAVKLQRRAARVGFDWDDVRAVLTKVREELDEVDEELAAGSPDRNPEALRAEIGDLLFAIANLARHVDVDPDAALRSANRKFRLRFAYIERRLAEHGESVESAGLDRMEALWNEAKLSERQD